MNRSGKIAVIAAVIISFLTLAAPGLCGLLITESDGAKSLVSDGKIKTITQDPEDRPMILDLKNGIITVLNDQEKTAARGTLDEFCQMFEAMSKSIQESMAQVKEQGIPGMPDFSESPVNVRIEKLGDGGEIAGFKTIKYKIYADGEPYEEAWITTDKKLTRELGDMKKLSRFEACASKMMGPNTVEGAAEYKELMETGWLLRSVSLEYGEREAIVDVESIEEKQIPDSEFLVPSGYKIEPLSSMMENMY